jgi:hypothetical protein
MSKSYDVIASLGWWCGPAFNIREYYGVKQATPFDWWIADDAATLGVLRDNFANLLQLENLHILDGAVPRETVRCDRYGIRHHHDFKRESDGGTQDGYHTDHPIIDDLASQIETVQAKHRFILERFRNNVRGRDVLMVRHDPFSDRHQMAQEIYQAFFECFQPRKLDLLMLSEREQHAATILTPRGSIFIEPLGEQIAPPQNAFWQENYLRAFAKLDASLRPATVPTE